MMGWFRLVCCWLAIGWLVSLTGLGCVFGQLVGVAVGEEKRLDTGGVLSRMELGH